MAEAMPFPGPRRNICRTPQGLNPVIREAAYGTAEAVPFPKPLGHSSAACGTAEAMPFPKTWTQDVLPQGLKPD
jgi:hypothetical protein